MKRVAKYRVELMAPDGPRRRALAKTAGRAPRPAGRFRAPPRRMGVAAVTYSTAAGVGRSTLGKESEAARNHLGGLAAPRGIRRQAVHAARFCFMAAPNTSGRSAWRETPVAASTSSTRPSGTSLPHRLTAAAVMPSLSANSFALPAAFFAAANPSAFAVEKFRVLMVGEVNC